MPRHLIRFDRSCFLYICLITNTYREEDIVFVDAFEETSTILYLLCSFSSVGRILNLFLNSGDNWAPTLPGFILNNFCLFFWTENWYWWRIDTYTKLHYYCEIQFDNFSEYSKQSNLHPTWSHWTHEVDWKGENWIRSLHQFISNFAQFYNGGWN